MNTTNVTKTVGATAICAGLGMKTMSVTGTMKVAVRRLASAAVGLAVGAALLGGVLVAATGSSRAGHWEQYGNPNADYILTADGITSADHGYLNWTMNLEHTVAGKLDTDEWWVWIPNGHTSMEMVGWVPGQPSPFKNDPKWLLDPPYSPKFNVASTAEWWIEVWNEFTPFSALGIADNGLGDPYEEERGEVFNLGAYAVYGHSKGCHIKSFDGSAGYFHYVSPTLRTAFASSGDSRPLNSPMYLGNTVQLVEDIRSVDILATDLDGNSVGYIARCIDVSKRNSRGDYGMDEYGNFISTQGPQPQIKPGYKSGDYGFAPTSSSSTETIRYVAAPAGLWHKSGLVANWTESLHNEKQEDVFPSDASAEARTLLPYDQQYIRPTFDWHGFTISNWWSNDAYKGDCVSVDLHDGAGDWTPSWVPNPEKPAASARGSYGMSLHCYDENGGRANGPTPPYTEVPATVEIISAEPVGPGHSLEYRYGYHLTTWADLKTPVVTGLAVLSAADWETPFGIFFATVGLGVSSIGDGWTNDTFDFTSDHFKDGVKVGDDGTEADWLLDSVTVTCMYDLEWYYHFMWNKLGFVDSRIVSIGKVNNVSSGKVVGHFIKYWRQPR
ncbi:MAG TPA: hypothetical protein VGK19_01130 [Capsulimonadaceae bacterium]|jgi:hypothetical protein